MITHISIFFKIACIHYTNNSPCFQENQFQILFCLSGRWVSGVLARVKGKRFAFDFIIADIPTQVFCSTLDRFAAPDFLLVVERQIQRQGDFLMNNEFTLPVTYPSVTRNLPEVTKLPTVTYPQVSRGRATDCSILQPKAKRQSRTQSKKLTGLLSNTQKGGEIYDGSAQKKYGSKKRRRTQIGAVRIRKNGLSGHIQNGHLNDIRIEELITAEAWRLSEQFGKTFLDCEDIVKLTGLGRDNVRGLMHKRCFPVVKAGNRQVVSILAFVTWQMTEYLKGENSYGKLKI